MSGASERANERTDERMAQYFSLYSWLFWTIVSSKLRLETDFLDKHTRHARNHGTMTTMTFEDITQAACPAAAALGSGALWSKTEKNTAKNSHLIIHFPSSKGARKQASKQTNERNRVCEQSEQ